MNSNLSYIERLGISQDSTLTIEGRESTIELKGSMNIIWIINETKKYIVDNIAQLLIIDPKFDDANIQTKIEEIRVRDKAITVLEHELIGVGKPYIIIDGKVWYSNGVLGSTNSEGKKTSTFYPSATCISEDVSNFKPLNRFFSKDSHRVISKYHPVGNNGESPDIDSFEAIGDTNYGKDENNLFCGFNHVLGADISNGISIISEDYEIIKDSNSSIFHGHEKVEVENPDELEYSCGNFFFDGVNIYLVYAGFTNITEMYELQKGENIKHIEGDEYMIGDKMVDYKDNRLVIK